MCETLWDDTNELREGRTRDSPSTLVVGDCKESPLQYLYYCTLALRVVMRALQHEPEMDEKVRHAFTDSYRLKEATTIKHIDEQFRPLRMSGCCVTGKSPHLQSCVKHSY